MDGSNTGNQEGEGSHSTSSTKVCFPRRCSSAPIKGPKLAGHTRYAYPHRTGDLPKLNSNHYCIHMAAGTTVLENSTTREWTRETRACGFRWTYLGKLLNHHEVCYFDEFPKSIIVAASVSSETWIMLIRAYWVSVAWCCWNRMINLQFSLHQFGILTVFNLIYEMTMSI